MAKKTKKERALKELIEIEWEEIDRLIGLIEGENKAEGGTLGPKERYRYSFALAAHVHRLEKLLWKAGARGLDNESLAKLLEKIPKRYKDIVLKKVKSKRAEERSTKEA